MLATECDNFMNITDCLSGSKPIDEIALSSVSVLAERLEMLKRSSSLFDNITFSPHVNELVMHDAVSALS